MEDHISSGNCPSLPLSCLRLLVPPFQLVSAAVWQTVQQKVVSDYGLLEEFVSMVTDVVPELLTSRQRAQLILGLRARLIVELCHFEATAHFEIIQPHLDRMHSLTTSWVLEAGATNTEPPLSDFADQVQNLLKKPQEREQFFLNVFPKEFGPKYDEALHNLMWLFLSRLEKFLSHQTFQQIASMFADVSSALEECMESVSNCEEVKTLLQHQKDLSQLDHNDGSVDGTCIISALKLSSVETVLTEKAQSESYIMHHTPSFKSGMEKESAVLLHIRQLEKGTAGGVKKSERKVKEPDMTAGKDGTSVLLGEVTRNKNMRTLPTRVKDKSLPQKECRVLVKRLDMPVSLQSRPVRRNRGLKMKMILLQEKRRLYGAERPAHRTMSTLKTATSETYTQTKTSQSGTKASSGAPIEGSDVEDSITTYKDLTNLAPVSNSSEDDSWSNCSDEEPSNMASIHDVDFTVLDKAQDTSDIKPAAARKTHSATRRGRCCICKEQVQVNMNAHMKTHFPNGDYACPRCDTKFTILSSLKLHLRRTCYDQQQVDPEEAEEAQTLFKCNECEKVFRYKLSLDEHKRTHNQLYCEVCRKVLRDPETLARHKASHTPFQCTLCEENFRLYKPLARHYENVHKLSRPFKCNHCPKSFSKLRYFIGHEWKHTGRLPFQCAQCHMRFKHDADLVSHLRVHTREKPFLCADCGKAFSCRSNLRRHLNFLHSQSRDERRYSCSLCEKSFKEKGALKKHEKSKHLQELFRYPCLYCGKLFSSSAMGRHKLIHTGEKPYKCQMPECDKHFRSTAEMKRHVMQYHTEERPFKCNVCGRGFIMSCLLKTHARTHSGEKPYICSLCGKAFPTLYSMKRHKKLMHTFDIE